MLELKELLEEREALRQEGAQKLKEEGLNEQKENLLLKQKNKLKRKKGYLLELAKRAEYNPRYYEEYEQLLRHKEYLRDYYRHV
ncbi:MAG: hypothetical protein HWN79_04700 [Candidatus Lokiarchaeota archaeon]|nr:hypothetical protein [Candidatus Lokiarchaeota archaeon]